MTRRFLLLTAMAVPLAAADPAQEAWDLFAAMASALAAGDSVSFLAAFDPAMPGFQALRTNIMALVEADSVQSAVEAVRNEGDAHARTVDVDWLLHLTSLGDSSKVTRRRETVHFRLERQGRRWKIIACAPLSFFVPPPV
jgi:hypothetical protein